MGLSRCAMESFLADYCDELNVLSALWSTPMRSHDLVACSDPSYRARRPIDTFDPVCGLPPRGRTDFSQGLHLCLIRLNVMRD